MTHDPELANETTRRYAAVTDAELTAGIRAAVIEVLQLASSWHAQPGWRQSTGRTGRDAWEAAEQVRAALAGLGEDATVGQLQAAVRPILGAWWPPRSMLEEAVDRLRTAALHMPRLVQDARRITSKPGWEAW